MRVGRFSSPQIAPRSRSGENRGLGRRPRRAVLCAGAAGGRATPTAAGGLLAALKSVDASGKHDEVIKIPTLGIGGKTTPRLVVATGLGKAKKAKIRLSSVDLLNRNISVTQYAGQNYVQDERVLTLARYFLLSVSYNMRGVQAKMRREGF